MRKKYTYSLPEKKCEICGNTYTPKTTRQKYCRATCQATGAIMNRKETGKKPPSTITAPNGIVVLNNIMGKVCCGRD